MTNPTIPHAPAGYNCLLSVRGYGSRTVRCSDISYGLVIGSSEDEAAARRAYYPLNQYIGAFTLGFEFASKTERDAFNTWMQTYMRKVSSNQRLSGYMFCQIPARNFAFNGIPNGPLIYGESQPVADLTYPSQIQFVGAQAPVSAVGKTSLAGVSQFQLPSKDTTDAPFFYPAGTQKSGAASLSGTLYDPVPVSQLPPNNSSGDGGGGGRRPLAEAW